jgi:hypothetical protein
LDSVTGCHENLYNTARHGRNQKHDTEETEEAEDLGVCVAGENSPQAAEILLDGNTKDTKEHQKMQGREDSCFSFVFLRALCGFSDFGWS